MIIIQNNLILDTPYNNLKDSLYYAKLYNKLPEEKIRNIINIKNGIDMGCSYGEKMDAYINDLFV